MLETTATDARFRLALKAARLGAWEYDLVHHTGYRSPELRDLLGVQHDQPTLQDYLTNVHPEDRPLILATFGQLQRGTLNESNLTYRYIRDDGEVIWVEQHTLAERDEIGQVTRLYGWSRDVTAQRSAQARQQALYAITRNFAGATTAAQVVAAILSGVMPAAQAARGSVGVRTPDGAHLHLLGELNYDAHVKQNLARFPLTLDIPGTHVVRTGQPVFGERAALLAQFSDLARVGPRELAAAAVLPLTAQGRPFGYLALVYDAPQAFDDSERAFLAAVAEQCALVLNRVQLMDEERRAREHLTYLAEAGEALTSSLDLDVTLTRLVNLLVPRLADWCAVYLPDGAHLNPHAVAHRDPAQLHELRAHLRNHAGQVDAPDGVAAVFRTGTALSVAAIDAGDAQRAPLGLPGVRAYLGVPLVAQGRTVGVMSFARTSAAGTFTPEDLQLAQELGRRAGLAVAHARLHQQLRDSHATLERRVEERTQALEVQAQELARSNAELEQFAYIASHDLQAPLRAVTSFAGLLERKYLTLLDDRGRVYLQQIVSNGTHMKRLVDDLLAFSRVHTEQRPATPVDTNEVLGEVLQRLSADLVAAGGTVTRDPLPTVLADASQLHSLLQNLVGNALKYHRPGVPPRVHVSAQRDGACWRFSVRDNGIGIERAYFERVFEIFQRLHTREQFEGTGVGLAICKRIVERHGGRLWLDSTPGEGTTFHFTLPSGAA